MQQHDWKSFPSSPVIPQNNKSICWLILATKADSFFPFSNRFQVLDPDYLINYPLKQDNHSLYISTLGLSLPIDGRHFKDGILLIRCVANFSPMVEGERNIVHRRPGMLDNREAILLGEYCS
jgi:hypothetical protein